MGDPVTIDANGLPVSVVVTEDTTVITVSHQRKPSGLPVLIWTFGPVQEQESGPLPGVQMTTLTTTQKTSGTVQPVDKKGHPAPVQAGTSVFVSSDPAVILVETDPTNELSVTVVAVAAGSAQCRWSADADLGDGVTTISAAEDFVVTASQAVGAGFTFGTPVEQ